LIERKSAGRKAFRDDNTQEIAVMTTRAGLLSVFARVTAGLFMGLLGFAATWLIFTVENWISNDDRPSLVACLPVWIFGMLGLLTALSPLWQNKQASPRRKAICRAGVLGATGSGVALILAILMLVAAAIVAFFSGLFSALFSGPW
jgi:hypothetical protein